MATEQHINRIVITDGFCPSKRDGLGAVPEAKTRDALDALKGQADGLHALAEEATRAWIAES